MTLTRNVLGRIRGSKLSKALRICFSISGASLMGLLNDDLIPWKCAKRCDYDLTFIVEENGLWSQITMNGIISLKESTNPYQAVEEVPDLFFLKELMI